MSTAAPPDSSGAEDGAAELDWAQTPAATVLPAAVGDVLTGAFDIVRSRPGTDFGDVLTAARTHDVLNALVNTAALRAVGRKQRTQAQSVRNGDTVGHEELADALVATGQDEAEQAAVKVKALLAAARKRRARERKASRNADRPTAEEKRLNRDREQIAEARSERDRARAQREEVERRLEGALTVNDSLASDLEETRAQLASTERQLAALRLSLTDIPRAAERMLDGLRPPTKPAGVVRDMPDMVPAPSPTDALLRRAAEGTLADVMPAETRAEIPEWLPRLLDGIARPQRLSSFTDLTLTVDVLGGGDEVGGSCVLVSAGGTRVLIDCGVRPTGNDETTMAPPHVARALAERIDAIVLTHAHNDHIGWVPVVVAKQPHMPVIATLATCDLAATMWADSARVLARRTSGPSWEGGPLPPYSDADVDATIDRLRDVTFNRTVTIGALTIELFPAGHIVGAAGVVVTAGQHRVVVSGDVSPPGQKSVGGFVLPESGRAADLMLLESTYGDDRKQAEARSKVVADFVRQVQQTVESGGVALVPSFALGRAQEIALICAEQLPEVEVLVDGLARAVSDIYEKHPGPNGEPLTIFRGNVRRVEPGKTIDEKLRMRSGVVIATSGMLNQGPAVEWARRVLPDRNSALLLVGYQDAQSPGKALLRLQERGGGKFSLPLRDGGSEEHEVHAQVEQFHLGAHANVYDLTTMASAARPDKLMLVHGEVDARQRLGDRMVQRSQRIVSPTQVWQPGR